MKTIEEKAKRYDEAISIAREYDFSLTGVCAGDVIQDIFPELAESEDEKMMNQLHSWMKEFGGAEEYTEKVYQWIKGLLEKQGEQKPAEWSEEDEQHIDSLLKRLDGLCRNEFERTRFAISEDEDWLESLKDRYAWKPSKEQIMALRWVLNHIPYDSHKEEISGLLEQLKKLREE